MNIVKSVFEQLKEREGDYVSGEEIAQKLNVSRQAVWKAVVKLQEMGYHIDKTTNRGYLLHASFDMIDVERLRGAAPLPLIFYEEVDSTNRAAKREFWETGECLVVANSQTQGKKKDGSEFYSPKVGGVYMTMALRLSVDESELALFRRQCAEQTRSAIEDFCHKTATLRNVDDVYVDDKKVCGQLIECDFNVATQTTNAVFIGIGIYTAEQQFVDESSGSILLPLTREELILDICKRILILRK